MLEYIYSKYLLQVKIVQTQSKLNKKRTRMAIASFFNWNKQLGVETLSNKKKNKPVPITSNYSFY